VKDADFARLLNSRNGSVERIVPSSGCHNHSLEEEHRSRYRWASAKLAAVGTVLDVASGVGYGAPILRAGTRRVVSSDISVDALAFGNPLFRLCAVAADAERLPFVAGAFDAVVSLETIEHVPHPDAFLRELRRILKDEGSLLISTPNRSTSGGDNPHHLVEFDAGQLEQLLTAAGFAVVERYGQQPCLQGGVWRIRGLRRLAWKARRSPRVYRDRSLVAPLQFCWRCVAL
jgi:O-antigen biosynthesis protein